MAVPTTETTKTAPTSANSRPRGVSGIGSQAGRFGGRALPEQDVVDHQLGRRRGDQLEASSPTESVTRARAIDARCPSKIR